MEWEGGRSYFMTAFIFLPLGGQTQPHILFLTPFPHTTKLSDPQLS